MGKDDSVSPHACLYLRSHVTTKGNARLGHGRCCYSYNALYCKMLVLIVPGKDYVAHVNTIMQGMVIIVVCKKTGITIEESEMDCLWPLAVLAGVWAWEC
jgi:hypothetical protein